MKLNASNVSKFIEFNMNDSIDNFADVDTARMVRDAIISILNNEKKSKEKKENK